MAVRSCVATGRQTGKGGTHDDGLADAPEGNGAARIYSNATYLRTAKEKETTMKDWTPHKVFALALAMWVATIGVFGPTTQATAAPTKEQYRLRGPAASGALYAYDDCGYTDFYVDAHAYWEKNAPGAPTSNNAVYADFYQSRYCGDTWSSASGSGFVSDAAQLDPKLDTSSASVSFDVYVYTCGFNGEDYACTETVVPFSGTMTWTGVGETSRGKSSSSYKTPSAMYRSHYNGSWREAEVSGSGTLDGVPVSFSEAYGSLSSINSGTLSVSHNSD
jgi:hypothetical protein